MVCRMQDGQSQDGVVRQDKVLAMGAVMGVVMGVVMMVWLWVWL